MAFSPARIARSSHDIGCKPRVMFEASPMIPNAANRKLKYWQTLPNSAHLLISAFMCSRFLKGWFSKLLAMTGIASFFLSHSSMVSSCIKDLREKVPESWAHRKRTALKHGLTKKHRC